jgi:hypothetical protein
MTRLMLALRAVVEKTGEVGDKALEEHCADREEQDQENADYHQDAQEDLENAEDDDIPY